MLTMNATEGAVAAYGGVDPRDLPAYTITDAAAILRMSRQTLKNWATGWHYPTKSQGVRETPPLILLPSPEEPLLSFKNVIEAYVLSAIRREYRIQMHKVRSALAYVEKTKGYERPLHDERFETDGIDLFIENAGGKKVDASSGGQHVLPGVMDRYLVRIEIDAESIPRRFFPFTRPPTQEHQPKIISIDPLVAFGRPTIHGTGVATEVVATRFVAGDTLTTLQDDFGIDLSSLEEAIRWEMVPTMTAA